jgi:Leucine-rich repeat (LRR) protein
MKRDTLVDFRLITLNLAHNRISRLDAHAFRRLPNLIKLDLQSNRLKVLDFILFISSAEQ